MYKGFELPFNGFKNPDDQNKYRSKGEKVFNEYENIVFKKLDSFLKPNGNIDGSELIENWFPSIECDIFISHSHTDHDIALQFAGYMNEHFGLKCFIDSCIWGYSNDLLKEIDSKLSKINDNRYDYNSRNFTTGHVHMMLATALCQMIYNTECLILLKTTNSIPKSINEIVNRTQSAWIYLEIKMSRLLDKKTLNDYRKLRRLMFTKGLVTESIDYVIDTDHLTKIAWTDLQNTKKQYIPGTHPLDLLYKLTENNELVNS